MFLAPLTMDPQNTFFMIEYYHNVPYGITFVKRIDFPEQGMSNRLTSIGVTVFPASPWSSYPDWVAEWPTDDAIIRPSEITLPIPDRVLQGGIHPVNQPPICGMSFP